MFKGSFSVAKYSSPFLRSLGSPTGTRGKKAHGNTVIGA